MPARQVSMLGRTMPYAYHARRSQDAGAVGRKLLTDAVSLRQAKRAAHYWRQRFGLLLVILAVAIGVGNLLLLDTTPTIQPISSASQPAFLHQTSEYQRAAERILSASLLNRNKITVDAGSISNGLKREFPELAVVAVTLPFFGHRPIIHIAQSDPALLLTTTDAQSFVIDTEGRAIANGSAAPASLQLLPVRDESGIVVHLGQLAVPSTTVDFIRTVHFQLAQRQDQVRTFVLPSASSELDIYLQGQKYYVKCNLASGTALQQAGTFLATQQYFEGRGIVPSQYVDVRLDGRAYYK